MRVVVPMAGRGSRFAEQGIETPKPLVRVAGRPMVAWALESLGGIEYSEIVFVALREHEEQFGVSDLLRRLGISRVRVVLLEDVTDGQLCSVLAAREHINRDEDVLIASSDTYVESELGREIAARRPDCRGIISVADMPGNRWSFARTDEQGVVVEVTEKVRISGHASTGLYYFANGREFVAIADDMIRNEERTRGEYYVIPTYQKYIDRGWRVEVSVAARMWDMGTPEALALFEAHLSAAVSDL